jgi:hypothetical protein
MPRYVLDTSALLTVLNNEPGVDTVLSILEAARSGEAQVYLPFMALMELEYLSLRQRSQGETRRLLTLVEAWPVEIEDSTQEWHHEAALGGCLDLQPGLPGGCRGGAQGSRIRRSPWLEMPAIALQSLRLVSASSAPSATLSLRTPPASCRRRPLASRRFVV